jgi:type I restriction enzyme S subunit
MTLETFFEKFDLFADAPDAVAKMRELVLQLAAHGRLLGQSPDDEPASNLVSRIEKKFEALRARGELRDSPVEPLEHDNLPTIPLSWEWVRLGNVVAYGSSEKVESSDIAEEAWLLDLEDIEKDTSRLLRRKTFRDSPSKSTKTSFTVGDVLYGKLRPYLNKVIVADALGYCTTEIIPIRTFGLIEPAYLCYALKRPEFIAYANSKSYGMNLPRLGTEDGRRAPIPLPPLAEQKRIVAKVDELMVLCDRLEAQQQERETRHAALARASLARFADAPTPANLPFLFHPSYSILPADLRKSILTLAVQGKLVPQDLNDEPVERALRTCVVDMNRWAVTKEEKRQDVPSSWVWIRFAGVGEQRLGKMLDAQKNRGESKPYLRNTNVQWMRFGLDDVKEMRVEEREEEELRLKHGDLLICEGGEPGRCAIWRDEVPEMYFQKALHRIRPCDAILSEFLALNLQIDCQNGVLAGYFTGATIKHLTGRSLSTYPIPIPPLAEQRRIVAKVDQLMALVDELETQLADSRATAAKLLSALVAELTTKD